MRSSIEKTFDSENTGKIKEAIAIAETGTSGQVVPCVVDQSSDYEEASAKAFFYTVVIAAIALAAYEWKHDLWFPQFRMSLPLIVISILFAAGMLSSVLIHSMPWLKRMILGKARMSFATFRQAKIMFLDQEVFRTKNRTGILIFISLFERQVHVMADKGLHDKVTAKQWDEVVALIIAGIKKGHASEGMINGIQKCGEILRTHSPRTSEDGNELPDDLNVGKFKR